MYILQSRLEIRLFMQILLIMLVVACYFMHLNYDNILLRVAAATIRHGQTHARTHTQTRFYA